MEEKLNFDKVWAMFQETREQIKATSEQMKETDRKFQETDRKFQETDRKFQETDRKFQETDKEFKQMQVEMKNLAIHLGGMGNSNGAFAENYFYNSLNARKKFGNEHFDHADLNVKPSLSTNDLQDEYDIVLLNGKSVAIIEVKYRAKKEHVAKTIHKATTFRQFFPAYKDFTFYLGLAGFSFDEDAEQEALNAGLVVLKQVGDTLVIHDEQIKKF